MATLSDILNGEPIKPGDPAPATSPIVPGAAPIIPDLAAIPPVADPPPVDPPKPDPAVEPPVVPLTPEEQAAADALEQEEQQNAEEFLPIWMPFTVRI